MQALYIVLGTLAGLVIGAAGVYYFIRPQVEQKIATVDRELEERRACLLYTSPSPRDPE